jgi:FAD/FMN-containing dehydrogenase
VGSGKAKLLPLEHGAEGVELMRRIKTALDPNNVMNPGKIFYDDAALQ